MKSTHTTLTVNIHSQHNIYHSTISSATKYSVCAASSFYSEIVCRVIPHRKSMRPIKE